MEPYVPPPWDQVNFELMGFWPGTLPGSPHIDFDDLVEIDFMPSGMEALII